MRYEVWSLRGVCHGVYGTLIEAQRQADWLRSFDVTVAIIAKQ